MSRDPFRLGVTLTHADGRKARWSGDEHKPGDVPMGLQLSSSIPGGHRGWSCTLARRSDADHPDLNLYDDVRVYAPGNKTVWAGQQRAFPGQLSDSYSVDVQGVGHAIELTGDPRPYLFIDRDLSKWGPPSRARHLAVNAVNSLHQAQVKPDSADGLPAIWLAIRGPWGAGAAQPLSEIWYDAGPGNEIDRYAFSAASNGKPGTADAWNLEAFAADEDDATGTTGSLTGNLWPSGLNSVQVEVDAQRYAFVQWYYNGGAGGTNGLEYVAYLEDFYVVGTHELTQQTGEVGDGFYLEDMIAYVVGQVGTGLTYEIGGSIERTGLVIPHAVLDPMDGDKAIEALNAPALWPFGVYGKEFFYRHPNSSYWTTWSTRLAPDGAHVTYEGPQAVDGRNGVVVRWRNPDGSSSVVAPPGAVYPDTDSALEDTDSNNPATAHGKRRWQILDIPYVSTREIAIALAAAYLRERAKPQRRGTLTVPGWIRHPTKGPRPVFEVKAGDYVLVGDHVGDVPRRIIQADYDQDNNHTATFTLDNTAHTVEALMEYIGVAVRDLF